MKTQNPFYYGEEVAGEFFTNRKKEIEDLVRDLIRGQNVIVLSPRRYGKTSLMKKVLSQLAAKGLLTYYINLYSATSKHKFIDIYGRAITKGMSATKIEQAINLLKNLLPHLIPKITINPPGLPEIEFDYGKKVKSVAPILEDLYEAVEKYARRKKRSAVIVFDEFQEIMSLEDDEIERSMRQYVQSQKGVTYVFMGSKKHLMQKLFNDVNRPFYKSGRIFPLAKISSQDFAVFIKSCFSKSRISISDATIENILKVTECHPYYTQLLCSILWDRNIGKEKINDESIISAVEEAISRESSTYSAIWDGISRKKKLLLEALARGGGNNVFSQSYISEFDLGSPSAVQKGIKVLQTKEIIDRENGIITFSDIFFKQWILRKMD